MDRFADRGWVRFPFDPALAAWANHANAAAVTAETEPKNATWLRCGGTWFVGVDALPNDADGRLPGGPQLAGAAIRAARQVEDAPLHAAQASVIYKGYPRQGDDEDNAAFRFRARRDAAHVDGLHRIMPGRRRLLKERHAWILGIPLNNCDAAPMTVWEGSHELMREALTRAYCGIAPAVWDTHDITEPYQATRKRCFDTLKRVELRAKVGEAYLIHRLALHGVAPWGESREPGEGRRAIAYFRPELSAGATSDAWLTAP